MMASTQPAKKIILKSSDNEIFEVEEAVAAKALTIKLMIDDGYGRFTTHAIPLLNVGSKTLSKVIEYCNLHKDDGSVDEEIMKRRDADFIEAVDLETLYELTMAANYLDIESLQDLTCQTFANMIDGKKPAEVRKILNIENDLTPEEVAKMPKRRVWRFE